MTRSLLPFICLFVLFGCGGDAVRSTKTWAEVRHAITPDLDSQAICDAFGCIPTVVQGVGFSWALTDGQFTGEFYPSADGRQAMLLFGRFEPTGADRPPLPEAQALEDMTAVMHHWQRPDPLIRERIARLRLGGAVLPDSDRRHQERLLDGFLAEISRVGGAERRLPPAITIEQPGDLDLIWVQFFASGNDRLLAHMLTAVDDRQRPAVCFPARWSLSSNLRQQAPLRERIEKLIPTEKRSPALRAILTITQPARTSGG